MLEEMKLTTDKTLRGQARKNRSLSETTPKKRGTCQQSG